MPPDEEGFVTEREGGASSRWILLAVIIGSGIVFLDGSVVTLALPKMGRELPTSVVGVLEGQAYITSGYLAVLAALLILGGALADRYGRRRIFSIGLAAFGIVSLLCGLAPTMEAEVVFRLAQGAAGALLVPGSLAIITTRSAARPEAVPSGSGPHQRPRWRCSGRWSAGSWSTPSPGVRRS